MVGASTGVLERNLNVDTRSLVVNSNPYSIWDGIHRVYVLDPCSCDSA